MAIVNVLHRFGIKNTEYLIKTFNNKNIRHNDCLLDTNNKFLFASRIKIRALKKYES